MTPSLLLPFLGIAPGFAGPLRSAGVRSAVLGRATLGLDATLCDDAVVRADGDIVRIGDRVWLGPRATVHIVHDALPAIIGSDVTVGANAIVHACTVGDNCVIEDDVTILDGATLESDVLIEAGATVFPRHVLKSGSVYAGSPAQAVRGLAAGELAARAASLRRATPPEDALPDDRRDFGDAVFIARTSQRAGALHFAPGSSLFFSCVADAGAGSIRVGANTNVQDNTVMRPGTGDLVIGSDTTIGHNVRMGAASIGAKALVGIGAVLADRTVIQDDVLLAAGATTEAGQVLESGWLWGGRPAKPLSRLNAARRETMAQNILNYCSYSQTFRRLQREQDDRSSCR